MASSASGGAAVATVAGRYAGPSMPLRHPNVGKYDLIESEMVLKAMRGEEASSPEHSIRNESHRTLPSQQHPTLKEMVLRYLTETEDGRLSIDSNGDADGGGGNHHPPLASHFTNPHVVFSHAIRAVVEMCGLAFLAQSAGYSAAVARHRNHRNMAAFSAMLEGVGGALSSISGASSVPPPPPSSAAAWFPTPWCKGLLFGSSALGGSVAFSDVDVLLMLGASLHPQYQQHSPNYFEANNSWSAETYFNEFPSILERELNHLLKLAVEHYAASTASAQDDASYTAHPLLHNPHLLPKVHVTPITAARVPVLKFVFCDIHVDVVMTAYCPPLRWFDATDCEEDRTFPFSRKVDPITGMPPALTPGTAEGDGALFMRHVQSQQGLLQKMRMAAEAANNASQANAQNNQGGKKSKKNQSASFVFVPRATLDVADLRAIIAQEAIAAMRSDPSIESNNNYSYDGTSPPSIPPLAPQTLVGVVGTVGPSSSTSSSLTPQSLPASSSDRQPAGPSPPSPSSLASLFHTPLAKLLLLADAEEALLRGTLSPAIASRVNSQHMLLASAAWLVYRRIPLASMRGAVNGVRSVLMMQRLVPSTSQCLGYTPAIAGGGDDANTTASGRLDASKTPSSLPPPLAGGTTGVSTVKISQFPSAPLLPAPTASLTACSPPQPPSFSFYYDVYTVCLRFIKQWARRRGIYGNLYGYAPGVAWAVLSVRGCQLTPSRFVSVVLRQFFKNMPRLLASTTTAEGGAGGGGGASSLRVPPLYITKSLFLDDGSGATVPGAQNGGVITMGSVPRIGGLMDPWRPAGIGGGTNGQASAAASTTSTALSVVTTDALPIISPAYPFGNTSHTASAGGRRRVLDEMRLAALMVNSKPIRVKASDSSNNSNNTKASFSLQTAGAATAATDDFPVNSLLDLVDDDCMPPLVLLKHPSYDLLSAVAMRLRKDKRAAATAVGSGCEAKAQKQPSPKKNKSKNAKAAKSSAAASSSVAPSSFVSLLSPAVRAQLATRVASYQFMQQSLSGGGEGPSAHTTALLSPTSPLPPTIANQPLLRFSPAMGGGFDAFLCVDAVVSLRAVRRLDRHPNTFFNKLFGIWAGFVESRLRYLVYSLEGLAERDSTRTIVAQRSAQPKEEKQSAEKSANATPSAEPFPPIALVGLEAICPFSERIDRKVLIDDNSPLFTASLKGVAANCGTMVIGLRFKVPEEAIEKHHLAAAATTRNGKGEMMASAHFHAKRKAYLVSPEVSLGISQLLQPAINDFLYAVESACTAGKPYHQHKAQLVVGTYDVNNPSNQNGIEGGTNNSNPNASFFRDSLMLGPYCRLLASGEATDAASDVAEVTAALSNSDNTANNTGAIECTTAATPLSPLPIVVNNQLPRFDYVSQPIAERLRAVFGGNVTVNKKRGRSQSPTSEDGGDDEKRKAEKKEKHHPRNNKKKGGHRGEEKAHKDDESEAEEDAENAKRRSDETARLLAEKAAMAALLGMRRSGGGAGGVKAAAAAAASPFRTSSSAASPFLRGSPSGGGNHGNGILAVPQQFLLSAPPSSKSTAVVAPSVIIDGQTKIDDSLYPRFELRPLQQGANADPLFRYDVVRFGRRVALTDSVAIHRQSEADGEEEEGEEGSQQQQLRARDPAFAAFSSNTRNPLNAASHTIDYFDYAKMLPEELCVPLE